MSGTAAHKISNYFSKFVKFESYLTNLLQLLQLCIELQYPLDDSRRSELEQLYYQYPSSSQGVEVEAEAAEQPLKINKFEHYLYTVLHTA